MWGDLRFPSILFQRERRATVRGGSPASCHYCQIPADEIRGMPSPISGTIVAVALVSAVPLGVAAVLPRDPAALHRTVRWLVGFATGALLGTAVLHMIPETFAQPGGARWGGVVLLIGFFGFFLLERHLWRHQHEVTDRVVQPTAALNLLGDAAHNFVDGMAIAAAFLVDTSLGITTSLAVLLHEVPQEMGDYGILLHAGLSRRRAIAWNLISGLVAMVGALAVLAFGSRFTVLADGLIPFAAGGFLYIASADLIPRLREEVHVAQTGLLFLSMLLGVGLTALPLLFE
jgi:zinc and cadmium transporter